jgi:serine/threonine-protein kinase
MRCPTCGGVYGGDARFCTRDGSRLVPVSTTVISAKAPPTGEAPVAPGAPIPTRELVAVTASKPVAPDNMVGQVLDGRYQVVRKVGEGGMSHVYLATDRLTEHRFAIKILSPGLAAEQTAMARLRREAELGAKLAHPNVCHIERLGQADGLVYVVMPFIEGEILSDRNYRVGRTTLADTVKFIAEIADGLQVAHELSIVHRDLKPENIMVCKDAAGAEHAVVMDFGLAKERKTGAEREKLTATGIILGTPEFMSPEQLRGKPLDARSDIFALSLMAYEMLTGKLPWEGRNAQEMMVARLRQEPIPARTRRPDLPHGVDAVLLRAIARAPEDRYATAPEFARALRQAAE